MNELLALVRESETVRFADYVRSLEAQGHKITKLQTGDPDFDTHPCIVEAGYEAMLRGLTHYSNTRGLPDLRQAISHKLWRENSISANPDSNILITQGGAHGVYIAIQSLINPGDEVLLPEPFWMPYKAGTILARGVPKSIPTDSSQFKLTPDALKAAITNRTKAIVFNSPSNPSGRVYSKEELIILCEIAVECGLYIISDEVYEHFIFDDIEHFSPASNERFRDKVITIFSFSKSYAMTGWRIGYLVAQENLVQQMLKILQYSITHVSPIVQKAALAALVEPDSMNYLTHMRNEYSLRRKMIANFSDIHLNNLISVPDGAFYCLIDISAMYKDGIQAAQMLLQKYSVGFIPGIAFGESTKKFLRMTFAAKFSDIEIGLAALKEEQRLLLSSN